MRAIDLTGQRFGRLVVLEKSESSRPRFLRWLCKCDCGVEHVVLGAALRGGNTLSCGCLSRDRLVERVWKHGLSNTRTHRIWSGIIKRCTNPKDYSYHRYGGRGITVCERWLTSFQAFYDDMGECPDGLSIERIDVNKGYSPENCKWATFGEQCRNRRSNRLITYQGRELCVTDWAPIVGISAKTIFTRLNVGWSDERAITEPVKKKPKN